MTFETFFAKKKIDLFQLEKSEPLLYGEFKSHFNLMGEKSFDHSKKFWFNKLRRSYPLVADDKVIVKVEESKLASQAEPLSSITIEQTMPVLPASADNLTSNVVAKPGFKPRNIGKPSVTENKEEQNTIVPELNTEVKPVVKKPGFKPRNVPAVKSNDQQQEIVKNVVAEENNETEKTTYKPKFNLKNLQKNSDKDTVTENTGDTVDEQQIEPVKQVYKPKFNLKSIPKVTEKPNDAAPDINSEIIETPSEIAEQKEDTVKPSYKPKFSMKNLPKVVQKQEEIEKCADLVNEESNVDSSKNITEDLKEEIVSNPIYKPKFKMRNLPKTSSSESVLDETQANANEQASENVNENPIQINAETTPKPAYKPRFNLKTPPKVSSPEEIVKKEEVEPKIEVQLSQPEMDPSVNNETQSENKPTGFKPRFRNIQPKKSE